MSPPPPQPLDGLVDRTNYTPPEHSLFRGVIRDALEVMPMQSSLLDKTGVRLFLPAGEYDEESDTYVKCDDAAKAGKTFWHCFLCKGTKLDPFVIPIKVTGRGTSHCNTIHGVKSDHTKKKEAKARSVAADVEQVLTICFLFSNQHSHIHADIHAHIHTQKYI